MEQSQVVNKKAAQGRPVSAYAEGRLLHRNHIAGTLNSAGNITLLAGGEAGQLAGQDFARLSDVTGQCLGFGEIEIEGIAGTLELTFSSHGRIGSKGSSPSCNPKKGVRHC